MIKLNILNMKNFLSTVNACENDVFMIGCGGEKKNINKQKKVQEELREEYKKCLRICLDIPSPTDYMKIVSYYAGDC